MSATPWLKFYPQDWRGEPTLRACSIAARGLWIEMIALAHEGTPYGHVLVNGNAPDVQTLARMVGVSESECESLVAELERNGVFSRTRKGVIYSRRMVKDAKRAAHARNIGKKGGNPSLSKQSENQAQVNPPDKPPDKPQIPEARYQKEPTANAVGRATRLRDDWTLPEEWRAWAIGEGWHAECVAFEAAKFRDHWHAASGQRATKRDWFATWRNWMRNVNKGKTNGKTEQTESIDREALLERFRARDRGGAVAGVADPGGNADPVLSAVPGRH